MNGSERENHDRKTQSPPSQSLRVARAALTRLMEPSDLAGMALIAVAGPEDALAFVSSGASSSAALEQEMSAVLNDSGVPRWPGLGAALLRWRPRLADLAPERDLRVVERLGGGLLVPEDSQWPAALAELELNEPIALWIRGRALVIPEQKRCIALVGSRDSTSYGANVATEMAATLVQRGFTIVSGGAYGIDAQAHRGAISAAISYPSGLPQNAGFSPSDQRESSYNVPLVDAVGSGWQMDDHSGPTVEASGTQFPPTLAIMAGGVDRFYPTGNEDLLRAVAENGAIIAEVPPGANPTRYRFLQRNRLIAALCEVTVVVEARWRSGALSTAHHADGLSRTVAAVPGSVYSANSAGCHRLLREGSAVCVTDAADVAELAGAPGTQLTLEQLGAPAVHDGLGVEDLMLLDALPLRSVTSVDKLTIVAGIGATAVLAGLGRLELLGLAERANSGWKRRN